MTICVRFNVDLNFPSPTLPYLRPFPFLFHCKVLSVYLRLTLSSPFLCPHLLEMEGFQTKSRVRIILSWSLNVLFVETQEVSVAQYSYRQSIQLESQEVLARCKFPWLMLFSWVNGPLWKELLLSPNAWDASESFCVSKPSTHLSTRFLTSIRFYMNKKQYISEQTPLPTLLSARTLPPLSLTQEKAVTCLQGQKEPRLLC